MKILSYNVMEGGVRPSDSRLKDLISVIRQIEPDVAGFQEAIPSDQRLLDALRSGGIFASVSCGEAEEDWTHGSGVAMASKKNLEVEWIGGRVRAGRVRVDSRIGSVEVVNVYLSHVDEEARVREVEELLGLLSADQPTVIFGDFNAISPEDNLPLEVASQFSPRMKEKYCRGGQLCFDTVGAFLRAGYSDLALRFNKARDITRCTRVEGGGHTMPIRMDYFFGTPHILELAQNVQIVESEEALTASDHFPWLLVLE